MADVNITIGAAFEELSSSLDSVRGQIADFGSNIQAVMGALGIAAIADFADHMADLGEQTERTAAMLGVSTTQVQELGLLAKLSGGDAQQMTLSLERMQLNMQRGQVVTSQQAAALRALGISAQEFMKASPHDAVLLLADAYKRLHDEGINPTAAGLALMGRSAAGMTPQLEQGSAAILAAEANMRQLGVITTPQTVETLSGLARQLTVTRAALTTMAETLTALTAKTLSEFSNELTQAAGNLTKLAATGQLSSYTIGYIGKVADIVVAQIERLRIALVDFFTVSPKKFFDDWAEGEAKVAAAGKALMDFNTTAMDKATESYKKLLDMSKQAAGTPISLGLGAPNAAAVAAAQAQGAIKIIDDMYKGEAAQAEAAAKTFQITEQQKTTILLDEINKREAAELAALQKSLAAQQAGTPQYQKIQDQIDQIMVKAANDREKVIQQETEKEFGYVKQLADQMASAFNSQLRGLLSGTTTWAQAMKNIFADMILFMIEKLVTLFTEWMALNAISMALGGGPISFSAVAGGGGGGALGGIVGSLLGGGSHQVGSSYVPQTGLALVHQGEAIIPAGANPFQGSSVPAAAGGATTNNYGGGFNLSVSALDSRSFANFLLNNRRAMEQYFNVFMRQNTGILQQAGAAAQ